MIYAVSTSVHFLYDIAALVGRVVYKSMIIYLQKVERYKWTFISMLYIKYQIQYFAPGNWRHVRLSHS